MYTTRNYALMLLLSHITSASQTTTVVAPQKDQIAKTGHRNKTTLPAKAPVTPKTPYDTAAGRWIQFYSTKDGSTSYGFWFD